MSPATMGKITKRTLNQIKTTENFLTDSENPIKTNLSEYES